MIESGPRILQALSFSPCACSRDLLQSTVRKFHAQSMLSAIGVSGLIMLAPLSLFSQPLVAPLMSVVDLDKGRPVEVKLHNGDTTRIELLESSCGSCAAVH